MNTGNRVLKLTVLVLGIMTMTSVIAATKEGRPDRVKQAIFAFTKGAEVRPSSLLKVIAPDIAERHDSVPVKVVSNLKSVDEMRIYVDVMAKPLLAAYRFSVANGLAIKAKFKLKRFGVNRVIVVVKAKGRYFRAEKAVRTIIPCNGGG